MESFKKWYIAWKNSEVKNYKLLVKEGATVRIGPLGTRSSDPFEGTAVYHTGYVSRKDGVTGGHPSGGWYFRDLEALEMLVGGKWVPATAPGSGKVDSKGCKLAYDFLKKCKNIEKFGVREGHLLIRTKNLEALYDGSRYNIGSWDMAIRTNQGDSTSGILKRHCLPNSSEEHTISLHPHYSGNFCSGEYDPYTPLINRDLPGTILVILSLLTTSFGEGSPYHGYSEWLDKYAKKIR